MFRIVAFFIFLLAGSSLLAQVKPETVQTDTARIQQINLTDGSVIYGYIYEKTANGISLRTKTTGILSIDWGKIESVSNEVTENKNTGKIYFKNPNSTRYFVWPSAIPLKKREGYYQNSEVFVNSFYVGITDHISIGAGFEILSLFNRNLSTFNFFVTPKFGFKLKNRNLYLGGGALHVNTHQYVHDLEKARQHFNIIYGSCTWGTLDHNLTVSVGALHRKYTNSEYYSRQDPVYDQNGNVIGYNYSSYYVDEKISEFSPNPVITISGMTRVGRKFGLITENWLMPQLSDNPEAYYGLFSYGFRIMGEKTSFDIGFINNGDIAKDIFIGIPYADVVIKF